MFDDLLKDIIKEDNSVEVCTKCLSIKSKNDFYKSKKRKNGLMSCCKKCNNKYITPENEKIRRLKYKYKLSFDEYNKMLVRQNNCCGICNREFYKTPCVDHCHKTNIIRGLVCKFCNRNLGWLEKRTSTILKWIGHNAS